MFSGYLSARNTFLIQDRGTTRYDCENLLLSNENDWLIKTKEWKQVKPLQAKAYVSVYNERVNYEHKMN